MNLQRKIALALSFHVLLFVGSSAIASPLLQECDGILEKAWDFTSTLPYCTDVPTAIEHGSRATYNGPFMLPDCRLQWFETQEACGILEQHFPHVVMSGESFMRHMNNALLVVLSGNAVNGSYQSSSLPEEVQECTCELQFNDGHTMDHNGVLLANTQPTAIRRCRGLSAFNSHQVSPPICPGKDILIRYVEQPVPIDESRTLYVVGGHALATRFSLKKFEQHLNAAITTTRKEKGDAVICVTTHSQGPNKPVQYISTQGNPQVLKFNAGLRDICEKHGLPVLDFFYVTKNTTTWDGQHFGLAPNALKAQILLNWMISQDSVLVT